MNYETAFNRALAKLKSEYPEAPHNELVEWAHEITAAKLAQYSSAAA